MSETNLIELPNELLEKVLNNSSISYKDLCHISCVSKRFNQIITKNNELWKKKFFQNWPQICLQISLNNTKEWPTLCICRHTIGTIVGQQVFKLSEIHYLDEELSNESFNCFLDYNQYSIETNLCHEYIHLFQINELEYLVSDGSQDKNLTIKYYALKVLRFLRHELLRHKWIHFLETESKDLFYGSLLISEWFQNKSLNEIHYRNQIDLISQLTVDEISVTFPMNSILKQNGCLFTDSEANQLNESKWNSKDCKQILLCLNEVLFNQLRFSSNDDNYYDINNSFMDRVIDRRLGIPITYCILYQTIAAKLGVKTFAVNFPNHFLLKWKQFENDTDSNLYTYIDVYRSGRFLNASSSVFHNCSQTEAEALGMCSTRDLFSRMCRNLMEIGRQQENSIEGLFYLRNALELLCIVAPDNTESRLLLSRVYLHLNINLEEVNEMLQKISESDPTSIGFVMFLRQSVTSQLSAKRNNSSKNNRKSLVKRRKQNLNINYAIGMIMSHKKYHYSCVIYGWDSKCAASRDWINQMEVYKLSNKDKQPFYNVLADDGSTRYAAQENLEPCPQPSQIKHPEIGKYFKEFSQTHYISNEQKAYEYPDDEVFLQQFLSQLKP